MWGLEVPCFFRCSKEYNCSVRVGLTRYNTTLSTTLLKFRRYTNGSSGNAVAIGAMGVLQRSTRRLLREAQLRHNDVLIPHARLFATPAVSAYRASQPSMTKISGGSSPVQLTDQPSDWTTHRNVQFSIRPSLLSPLYATYRQEQDLQATRTLTSHLITAHQILKEEHDGYDQEQVCAWGLVRSMSHGAMGRTRVAARLLPLTSRPTLPCRLCAQQGTGQQPCVSLPRICVPSRRAAT